MSLLRYFLPPQTSLMKLVCPLGGHSREWLEMAQLAAYQSPTQSTNQNTKLGEL